MSLSLTELTWLALAAYSVHMLEEFIFDWRDWARNVLHLNVTWDQFYITNAVVVVLGIVAAELAAAIPAVALGFPALMLINATFFHVLPFLVTRGRFSPGLVTAVILFYPVGIACYLRASSAGDLNAGSLIGSLLLGAALMASPVVMIKLKDRPYFRQDRP
ncbi:MAG TPA: HXXEE domain-containing protein [Pseudolabrys sp.]|nr:HXXEE domain-containing protein [Pseudolabrys sp.]